MWRTLAWRRVPPLTAAGGEHRTWSEGACAISDDRQPAGGAPWVIALNAVKDRHDLPHVTAVWRDALVAVS